MSCRFSTFTGWLRRYLQRSLGWSVACCPAFSAPDFFVWLEQMPADLVHRSPHDSPVDPRPGRGPPRDHRAAPAAAHSLVVFRIAEGRDGEAGASVRDARVIEAYGMTEASHQIASNPLPPLESKPGTVGLAAGAQVAIMSNDGRILSAGEIAEIVIRGDNVTRGYENNPEANRDAFVDGWFRTGDQGTLDDDGFLTITGRLKEMINRGGEKIAPREIDEVLLSHAAVAQAVTFGAPHATLGETIAAAVVLLPGCTATGAEPRRVRGAADGLFKVPAQILIVAEIPKGPTGKLNRIGMAAALGLSAGVDGPTSRATDGPFAAPRTELEATLANLFSAILKVERVGVLDVFFELGGDSMLATRLVTRVNDMFQIELPLATIFTTPTVAGIAEILGDSGGDFGGAKSCVGQVPVLRRVRSDRKDSGLSASSIERAPRRSTARCCSGSPASWRLRSWFAVSTSWYAATRPCGTRFEPGASVPEQIIADLYAISLAADDLRVWAARRRTRTCLAWPGQTPASPSIWRLDPRSELGSYVRARASISCSSSCTTLHSRRLVLRACWFGSWQHFMMRLRKGDPHRCRSLLRSSMPTTPHWQRYRPGAPEIRDRLLPYWLRKLRGCPANAAPAYCPPTAACSDQPWCSASPINPPSGRPPRPPRVARKKRNAVHEPAGRFPHVLLAPLHRPGRYPASEPRSPGRSRLRPGRADRALREHTGDADRPLGRSELPGLAATSAGDRDRSCTRTRISRSSGSSRRSAPSATPADSPHSFR